MVRITSFLLALLPLASASASASEASGSAEIVNRAPKPFCGAHSTPQFLNASAVAAAKDKAEIAALSPKSRISGSKFSWPLPKNVIYIPIFFHVVATSKKREDGWISDKELIAQYNVLNENFAPQKIKFLLSGIDRTISPAWATDVDELGMKKKLRRGDYKTFNVYFLKQTADSSFGYAYFPGLYTAPSNNFYLDGATILHTTLPGGTATNYNQGKTLTHEAGHWLGLAHTFDGFSCTGSGDFVADTAPQKTPTEGCPIGSDSCPDSEGLDPIHNYMDYSYDACYESFTPLQTKRMFSMYFQYRNPQNLLEWKWW